MRHVLLAAEVAGTALLMLALAAPVCGQTLGEVSAATGISGTLSRQGLGSSKSALGSAKQSLATSTKPRDFNFGSSSGGRSGSKPTAGAAKSSSRPGASGGGSARGSWATGGSVSRGSVSAAWRQGGSGWNTGAGGGGRASAPRRKRS